MNRLLLILTGIAFSLTSFGQTGFLFIKKGYKKKRTYAEGERIHLRLDNDSVYYGLITRLANDTIFMSGRPMPCRRVKEVIVAQKNKKSFHIDPRNLLLITGGVALVTAGLTLSNQAEFEEALLAGAVIGYGPLAVAYASSKISFKRKKYKIGKKFRLQLIDFYIPRKRAF